jgi:teichuronic acid biosynthesis glycosyltransferase TuaC
MNNNIKVLVVCSGNAGYISPFIAEQVDSLTKLGKGIWGYLKNLPSLIKRIRSFSPDLIHAHYGISGMLAVLQRIVPVIITFHGADLNERGFARLLSHIALRLSAFNIYASKKLAVKTRTRKRNVVISCGVDMNESLLMDKAECRKIMGFKNDMSYILFSSAFNRIDKNFPLAKEAANKIKNIQIIELKGYSRKEVNLLLNACDLLLVTSVLESGPLIVKEAVASGCPVVSTDTGDVREVIKGIEGCFLTGFSADEISEKIKLVLVNNKRTNARNKIYELELDIDTVAQKVLKVYKTVINKE